MPKLYIIRPYEVGSKEAKSLALIIPVEVRKEANINPSTIYTLRMMRRLKNNFAKDQRNYRKV